MRFLWLGSLLLALVSGVQSDSALYPPGLLPLINHANTLLSGGKFGDAVKAYSLAIGQSSFNSFVIHTNKESIEQSPADYLLYYKRATAYFSLTKHPNAITDFDKVIELTSNSFDKAHLMKARMYIKDGLWSEARGALKLYSTRVKNDETANELLASVTEGEIATKKASQSARAKLWTACEEASSAALAIASRSVEIRQQRAECSLAAGDLEMAVGDLTCVRIYIFGFFLTFVV